MKRVAPSDDDLDWNQLEMQALILKIRLQEAAEQHQKLTKDIKEQSSILPPSELLKSMAEAKEHDELATRSEERDFRRKQQPPFPRLPVRPPALPTAFTPKAIS
jgi:hypothetical protein